MYQKEAGWIEAIIYIEEGYFSAGIVIGNMLHYFKPKVMPLTRIYTSIMQ